MTTIEQAIGLITEENAQLVIDLLSRKDNNITIQNVIDAVCECHGLTYEQINVKDQSDIYRIPRQRVFYFAVKQFRICTLKDVSKYFIGRHTEHCGHATVINGCKAIENSRFRNPIVQKELDIIYDLIVEKSGQNDVEQI